MSAPPAPDAAPASLSRDLLASIVVFLVALPLCMGIAIASGVPPAAGLITGIVGGLLVGFIAGSPLQVSGPAAGLTVIVLDIVQTHGIAMLGPIVLAAGALQIAAGAAGLGRMFRAVSPAVVQGMLAGIGVLIIGSQLHVVVDDAPKGKGWVNLATLPDAIARGLFPIDGSSHHLAAWIGVGTVALLVGWERFKPARLASLPGALVAVVGASVAASGLGLPIRFVDVPADLTTAIALPGAAEFARLLDGPILLAVATLAAVASAESLLCAAAVDRMHTGPRTRYDQELLAQGVGNAVCGLLGALPMTGVIVRSTANVQAGGTSRRSAILHGAWLLVLVALLPGLLRLVPTSALAAILVYTGYKLVNVDAFRELARAGRGEAATYLVTLGMIVATDLLIGVLAGLGLALARTIASVATVRADVREVAPLEHEVEVRGVATFLAIPQLGAVFEDLPSGSAVRVRLEALSYADHGAKEYLLGWARQHRQRGGRVELDEARLEARRAA